MSVKKRYVFLSLFLLCLLGVSSYFAYQFFFTNGLGFTNSRVSFEWLIKPQLHYATAFHKGRAWVQEVKNGSWKLIDENGKTIVENFPAMFCLPYDEDTGLAPFMNLERLGGYVDLSGDVVIAPKYWSVDPFNYGMATVARVVRNIDNESATRQYGIIDRHGKVVFPLVYEFIDSVHPNLFVVLKGDKWGYVDEKGKVVADFLFDGHYQSVLPPNVCLAVVGKKSGLLDEKGQWILPASYDQVYAGREGLIGLAKDGKVGFVDATGKTMIDFQFTEVVDARVKRGFYTFSEGLAVVPLSKIPDVPASYVPEEVLCGVIDKSGKLLFKFQGYPYGGLFTNGFLLIQSSEDTFELMDRSGDRYPLPLPSNIAVESRAGTQLPDGIFLVYEKGEEGRDERRNYGYLKFKINY